MCTRTHYTCWAQIRNCLSQTGSGRCNICPLRLITKYYARTVVGNSPFSSSGASCTGTTFMLIRRSGQYLITCRNTVTYHIRIISTLSVSTAKKERCNRHTSGSFFHTKAGSTEKHRIGMDTPTFVFQLGYPNVYLHVIKTARGLRTFKVLFIL